jgi:hypothetical protein
LTIHSWRSNRVRAQHSGAEGELTITPHAAERVIFSGGDTRMGDEGFQVWTYVVVSGSYYPFVTDFSPGGRKIGNDKL